MKTILTIGAVLLAAAGAVFFMAAVVAVAVTNAIMKVFMD